MTRLEEATERAASRASSGLAPPVTLTEMSRVAPSPSRATWRARSRATSSRAASSCPASGVSGATGRLPAAPLARTRKVSLVELSPSTVTWLKEASATRFTSEAMSPGSTAASVVR